MAFGLDLLVSSVAPMPVNSHNRETTAIFHRLFYDFLFFKFYIKNTIQRTEIHLITFHETISDQDNDISELQLIENCLF